MSHEDLFREVLEKTGAYEAPDMDESTVMLETTGLSDEETVAEKTASSVTVVNLFRSPDAHPLVLDLALLYKYGPEWLYWELETLQLRISQDFNTPTVSDLNMEKVQACKALHLVDTFWLQWEVFLPCAMALNGVFADFEVMTAPSVAQCMVAVDIANRIREDVTWSPEIKRFLGVIHRHDDILCVQPPLQFVEIDVEGLPLDCGKVAEMWPEARRLGRAPDGDTIELEQLRRMLDARAHLEEDQKRRQNQLIILKHV